MRRRSWLARYSAGKLSSALAVLSLALAVAGCRPATPAGGGVPVPSPLAVKADAPQGEAIADPILREAREQADTILADLLAGKFDQDKDQWPLAKKVKGYQFCSIKSQRMVREGTAEFEGVLSGPAARASFEMKLVKQSNGRWEIGAFSGPSPD